MSDEDQTFHMKKYIRFIVPLAFLVPLIGGLMVIKVRMDAAQRTPEMIFIEDLYKNYFNLKNQTEPVVDLKPFFSKEFQKLWEESTRLCQEKAAGEVCGWDSEGNILLDAQEVDSELTYDTAEVRVVRFQEGFFEATFNVFPNDLQGNKKKPQHDRRIRFWIKQEDNKWVIDNIAYVYPNTVEDARAKMKEDQEIYGKK